jgi:hypothetical protein
MKIYVASSWRNTYQPKVVEALRQQGHEVYDFHNPKPGKTGFHWSEIDPEWKNWSPALFARALNHPVAKDGFALDYDAMQWADACVLVTPCGRSAHLELGWAVGAGKKTYILLSDGEPELMYKLVDYVACSLEQLLDELFTEEAK